MSWDDDREHEQAHERLFTCHRCEDTGWVLGLACTRDNPCSLCAPPKRFLYAHTYTQPCACRDSNPVYIRKREAARQQIQGRIDKKGRAA